jgi:hypothetical protein
MHLYRNTFIFRKRVMIRGTCTKVIRIEYNVASNFGFSGL